MADKIAYIPVQVQGRPGYEYVAVTFVDEGDGTYSQRVNASVTVESSDVVQYAEGAEADTPTGTVVMWKNEGESPAQIIAASSLTPLPAQIRTSSGTEILTEANPGIVAGPEASGETANANPLRMAGRDSSGNTRNIATDENGNVQVTQVTLTPANDQVALGAKTAGGATSYSAISTAAVLTAQIKGSAGQIYDVECFNNGADEVFIRFYNQTGAPASTDAANIIWRGMIPGNAAGAGFVMSLPVGRECATGIGVRVTTGIADNDTGALTANQVIVNVGYK